MKHHFFIACMLVCLSLHQRADAQIITTLAGDGAMANGPDGIPGTSCSIYTTQAAGVDRNGNVYTEAGYRMRKIDGAGIISTVAGTGVIGYSGDGGPATLAQLGPVHGIVFDKQGNMFFGAGATVRKIDTFGIITAIAGTGVTGYSGDGGPATLAQIYGTAQFALDDTGNLYVLERGNHCIRKISTSGIISTVAGTGTLGYTSDGVAATAAQIGSYNGLAIDHHGNIYFAESANFRIRKIDAQTGLLSTAAGSGPISPATGTYTGVGGPATAATFIAVVALAIDNAGNIYATAGPDNIIHKISTAGIITTYAGTGTPGFSGDGGLAAMAELNAPWGIAIDDTGNVYFADRSNNRLRKISSGNHLPLFANGQSQTLHVCKDSSADISLMLGMADADTGQTLTWTLFDPPLHGTAVAAYTSTSTGGAVGTAGLSYTPDAGFTGMDTLRIRVDDGISADFTTLYISVDTIGCPTESVSVLNLKEETVTIFPNPGKGTFTLQLSKSVSADVTITDITGRKVRQFAAHSSSSFSLDVPDGVYVVSVLTENGVWNRRLVVR